jgi:hypothetical protein
MNRLSFVKYTYRTCSMLLKILPCALYTSPLCQSRLPKADVYLTYLMLQRQLIHLNAVSSTAPKFKLLAFCMFGFALSYGANMFILMILYDLCLLPAQFCYIIVYIRKFESRVQIVDLCAPWKIANGAENLILQALQF